LFRGEKELEIIARKHMTSQMNEGFTSIELSTSTMFGICHLLLDYRL
jgi:hypothetical protein